MSLIICNDWLTALEMRRGVGEGMGGEKWQGGGM